MITRESFEEYKDAVDAVCVECAEDTEDYGEGNVCMACPVRKTYDIIHARVFGE